MWTRALLKENGKKSFMRNYWPSVLVSMIAMAVGAGMAGLDLNFDTTMQESELPYGEFEQLLKGFSTAELLSITVASLAIILLISILGIAFLFFVTNVIQVGCNRFFIENRAYDVNVTTVFYGFRDGRYAGIVGKMALRELYIFLWSLLFIIPGIIKSYSYMMVPYILAEDSSIDKDRVLEISEKMMDGHKWEAFVLNLSFLGWNLLGALTFGMLNVFYINPYVNATHAEFYSALKVEARYKGILAENELSR